MLALRCHGKIGKSQKRKMDETNKEENSPVISAILTKPDEWLSQGESEMKLNKVFHEANM
jgi:hypothetical protein